MENNDEYEIIPHKEILELKKEIEFLKKNPLGKSKSSENLLDSINALNNNIDNLITVFKDATKELKDEKPQTNDTQVNKKIEELFDQNREIAEAIVSLADMIKENKKPAFEEKNQFPMQSPNFEPPRQSFPPPQLNYPKQTPPPGNPNQMPNFNNPNIPPPPGMDLPPPPKNKNNEFPF